MLAQASQCAGSTDLAGINHRKEAAAGPHEKHGQLLSFMISKISLLVALVGVIMYAAVPNSNNIVTELRSYAALRDRLLAEIPDLDSETLADTLEGITDLREMLAEVIRSALDDEALAGGLSTRLSDMKARLERLEERAKRKRQLALRAMDEADIPKLAAPDFTASLKKGAPALEVVAEDKIPAAYWKPQPSKLDKQGLLAALKSGTEIEGVALAAPQTQLSVRTK